MRSFSPRWIAAGPALVVAWLTVTSPPSSANGTRLNNFAVEHINTVFEAGGSEADSFRPVRSFTFQTDRDGWIFVSIDPVPGLRVAIDSTDPSAAVIVAGQSTSSGFQAMRRVRKGPHTAQVFRKGNAERQSCKLIVRSIPEVVLFPITFADWQREASDRDWFYRHEWDFVRRHLLPIANVLVFSERPEPFEACIKELHAEGKLALMKANVPPLDSTAEQIYGHWGRPLEEIPYVDGMTIDEFGAGEPHQKLYSTWVSVFEQVAKSPRCSGKKLYAFTMSAHTGRLGPLLDGIRRTDQRWLHEGYYLLGREENRSDYERHIAGWGGAVFDKIRRDHPGIVENNLLYTFGTCDYQWSFDLAPDRDFKVYLDMQFHHMAHYPSYEGIYGICLYTLNQTTEEMARYAAALVRHYCLEGRREPFNPDPIELRHLGNPGFEDGLSGWDARSARKDGIAVMNVADLPYRNDVSDRALPNGCRILCTVRSDQSPNVLSQKIVRLKAGAAYSLRVMTSDLTDHGKARLAPISIKLDGVELLHDKTMDRTWTNSFTRTQGTGSTTVCWNYHLRVFRAQAPEAVLSLSDWAAPDAPGGPVGHKVIWDFIKVQPYYESTPPY